MFHRKKTPEEEDARQDERDLEETRRRQARVLAQLEVLTQAVENIIPKRKEADGHDPAH